MSQQQNPMRVKTRLGVVRGALANDRIRVFKGIPYAEPPVEERRWKPPLPVRAWQGELDASSFGHDCPQATDVNSRAGVQSEDCLYLNIWAPVDARPASLPVMVWFHGGSFLYGGGSEHRVDGAQLASKDVVVVTFNYRVGVFGFFAHPQLTRESEHQVSGNYGLMDQILALQWVRDNIGPFGGDPDNVTAFGVSAGAASIALLLTCSKAHALFHKAILESPGAGRRLASLQQAEDAGAVLGSNIGQLRKVSTVELLKLTHLLTPKVRGLTTPRVLRPIRDGWLIQHDEPDAYRQGKLTRMPLIVGTNLDEGTEATKSWPINTLAQYRTLLADNFGSHAKEAFALYPATHEREVKQRVAELFGDTQFDYGTRLLARAMTEQGGPVWKYLFTRRRAHRNDGPHHGQEVHYVFGNLLAPFPGEQPLCDDLDRALSHQIMSAWVNFARTGDPNHDKAPYWSPFDAHDDNFLEFGDRVEMNKSHRREQLDFLDHCFLNGETS